MAGNLYPHRYELKQRRKDIHLQCPSSSVLNAERDVSNRAIRLWGSLGLSMMFDYDHVFWSFPQERICRSPHGSSSYLLLPPTFPDRDLFLADSWRPLYQPLDIILSQDHNQIAALLEFVRYSFLLEIHLCSIGIMSIISF
ncbi:hypothetical protein J5N97_012920 [Dioscorea zingiberensis]|uniref:Uncharacterized protein n=1 Tax=Dioscorea zingiberensis TaxID=325984 RepID=A0A9D5HI61_9LILI|nr:hypothetical protein J5N97_012920 [Dioscorea zingiberensis]